MWNTSQKLDINIHCHFCPSQYFPAFENCLRQKLLQHTECVWYIQTNFYRRFPHWMALIWQQTVLLRAKWLRKTQGHPLFELDDAFNIDCGLLHHFGILLRPCFGTRGDPIWSRLPCCWFSKQWRIPEILSVPWKHPNPQHIELIEPNSVYLR